MWPNPETNRAESSSVPAGVGNIKRTLFMHEIPLKYMKIIHENIMKIQYYCIQLTAWDILSLQAARVGYSFAEFLGRGRMSESQYQEKLDTWIPSTKHCKTNLFNIWTFATWTAASWGMWLGVFISSWIWIWIRRFEFGVDPCWLRPSVSTTNTISSPRCMLSLLELDIGTQLGHQWYRSSMPWLLATKARPMAKRYGFWPPAIISLPTPPAARPAWGQNP